MKTKTLYSILIISLIIGLIGTEVQSQEAPVFKYFDKSTMDEIIIDYDQDGDLDFIYAGVIADRYQGRVYLVENKGKKLGKPQYIYSFPTIPIQQRLEIKQEEHIIHIHIVGTSPEGVETNYVATLFKGQFQGLLSPPMSTETQ